MNKLYLLSVILCIAFAVVSADRFSRSHTGALNPSSDFDAHENVHVTARASRQFATFVIGGTKGYSRIDLQSPKGTQVLLNDRTSKSLRFIDVERDLLDKHHQKKHKQLFQLHNLPSSTNNTSNNTRLIYSTPSIYELSAQAKPYRRHGVSQVLSGALNQNNDYLPASLASTGHKVKVLKKTHVDGPSFHINGVRQWEEVATDNFDHHNPVGWSQQRRSKCGASGDTFLGGYCNFGGAEVATRTYNGLPPHTFVRIQGRFHFFDRWEGETASLTLNSGDANQTLWTGSHTHCASAFSAMCRGIHVCGDENYSDRLSYPIDVTYPHSDMQLIINFGTNLKESSCVASWGIDDIKLSIL